MNKQVRLVAMLGGVAVLALGAAPACAQASQVQSQMRDFDVPAQPLTQAVLTFSQQAGVQLVLESGTAEGMNSSTIKGRMSVAEAVTRLLSGTSLTWHFVNDRTITIEAPPQEGEHVLGAVRVEGVQSSPYFGGAGQAAGVNGINGSQDITATEGTGSFTSGALTIGSKAPQAMKDVPQSVSVLTSERMQQQNVTDFTDAMKQLPGVTVVQGDSTIENAFYSRGFKITSIQVDGGAPLSTNFGYFPQIDMSVYDHVELLRGAAGQFNFYGDPGGTVNLVRKKPLDHAQFSLEAQAGSWSNYRIVADATSPLALDGRLRGRLVMTYQDNHYFYDTAKDNKTLIYGITEFDATPTTLLTAGISHARQNSVPWDNGLPRYLDGADLKLPRSTAFVLPWNRWDFDTTEIFGGLEQRIGSEWTFKLNVTHNTQTSARKLGYSSGAVNPTNGLGPLLSGYQNDYVSKQLSAEATLNGAFELFGQRQEVTIGISRAKSDGAGGTYRNAIFASSASEPYQPYPGGPIFCTDITVCPSGLETPPIDVFHFDPEDPLYSEPANSLVTQRYPENSQIQSGAYLNLRLTAFDRLHLNTGIRWSRYESNYEFDYICTVTVGYYCSGKSIGDVFLTDIVKYKADDFSWPPSGSLSFDLTKQMSAYVGYTDIYTSEANFLDASHKPIAPPTGSNWEAGLKWSARNGRLNVALAAFRIRQSGFATYDFSRPYEDLGNGVSCCYIADPNLINRSSGIDFEVTGELRPGWQIAASYTYDKNKKVGSSFGLDEGQPIVSIEPKHLYKIWMSYDFAAGGHHAGGLSGLSLSGGINGQSSAYRSGATCINLVGTPDPVTGTQSCASNGPPDLVPFEFTVPAYALVSARIDYRLSHAWSLAINLENILNKTYYQTTGTSVTGGNWYGAPRSFTATLRAKW